MSTHYVGLVDGETGAYGVAFPDLPGCVAMGRDLDEAQRNAAEALREWVDAMEARGFSVPQARGMAGIMSDPECAEAIHNEGAALTLVPLVREATRQVKANLSLDSGILNAIDATAKHLKTTRSAVVEMLAKRGLHELA